MCVCHMFNKVLTYLLTYPPRKFDIGRFPHSRTRGYNITPTPKNWPVKIH